MNINRILKILFFLLEGTYYSTKDLADEFEVSERTIQRDISFIKETGIPIDYKMRKGFFIKDAYALKKEKLSKKEKNELKSILKSNKTITEKQALKLLDDIANKFADNSTDWLDIKFYDDKEENNFKKLKEAVIYSKLVELHFDNIKKTVKPYKLFLEEDVFFLFYYGEDKSKILDIKLNKIDKVTILDEK